MDYVTTNADSLQGESQLYIFEDTEAVIKRIIEGRSPTMRHVSRTDRVALYWLFDRINLDPMIQIKHVDTKNQLADMSTKESSHVMSCAGFLSNMSKRAQESTSKERSAVAKPRPMNCGVKEPPECEDNISARFECFEQPLRHTPILLCPESHHDGIWRNHIRESISVTSTSSEDFF